MQVIGLIILVMACILLLSIQYSMIVADIRNNEAKTWEIIVGIIPFGPYILMILTGVWYLITKLFPTNSK
jgi:small-conductance mechanosensitive channel